MRSSRKECCWYIITFLLMIEWVYTEVRVPSDTKSNVMQTPVNQTNFRLLRRRRFVRFPVPGYFEALPSGRGVYPISRFSPIPGSSWRQSKSYWRQSAAPVMAHRSPRLIFRDEFPTFPGSGAGASFFQSSNHVSPEVDDEFRDHRKQIYSDYPKVDTECGISSTKQTAQRRIVGGDEAGFGSFPWQAYIRIGSSRCGGTLVNRYHVVTAGHCVAKASARQVQVTLGDYVVNSASESLPAYTFGVREIRVHPYFKFTPQADRFDVAVLRLDRPVHYMAHISPICLPDKNEDFLGQYGWAAGWGALQAGSRLRPKTLQSVDVPVIDNRVCERWHRTNGINVVIYDEMMCAGYRGGGKDSCQGDSGGPLMLERTGRWYLIGIVSAGYSCAQPGQPGIYHRVAKTVDWITYVINS
ncbi:serine proteinase stubble-like isoform X2 [Diachasmimorpha longicaudata]|uniref:serine proteinase stubble-like isoform X2 n=1 Tax=Diachasmimorpha longicaudata TaxID=58733 RepID=UPI0030B8D114